MKEHKEKGVDLGLRQFIKSLGYVAGGTALLATTPWLTSCTPEKLQEIKHEKARIALNRVHEFLSSILFRRKS